jgi:hypothetical protein
MNQTNCFLVLIIILLIFVISGSRENMCSAEAAVSAPNDWNQYIRDEAQRVVYMPNKVARTGYCFPEVVGWPTQKAADYIKSINPALYIVLNDERVPSRNDIYYYQPFRVTMYFDSRGLVSRIPLSG